MRSGDGNNGIDQTTYFPKKILILQKNQINNHYEKADFNRRRIFRKDYKR